MLTPEEMMLAEANPNARAAFVGIEHSKLSPDQARARLIRDGANLTKDEKDTLTQIASGLDAPKPRLSPAVSPFGNPGTAVLTGADIADGDDLVWCNFPQPLRMTDRPGRVVYFPAGNNPVPKRFVEPVMLAYLRLNGVTVSPNQPAQPEPPKEDDDKPKIQPRGKAVQKDE